MTGTRLESGGLVDRTQPITFWFDGRKHTGLYGDTIASALLANGIRVFGRSFKYHRPRGVWGSWTDDPNAIVTVSLNNHTVTNCLATATPLEDGMRIRSVNAWPTAGFDLKAGLDIAHRWLGAGFYYKTFMWPTWHVFEPAIRRMAGLGAASLKHPEDYIADQVHDQCETLVVGGGVAGLTAARAAAEAGQDVVLVDDHDVLGGSIYQLASFDGRDARVWVADQLAAIRAAGGRVLTRATAFGVYDHGLIAVLEKGAFADAPRLHKFRVGRTVLATGALDRPVTFEGNDKPGVMSLAAAAEYAGRYGVRVGSSGTVLSNHTDANVLGQRLGQLGMSLDTVDATRAHVEALGWRCVSRVRVDGTTRPCQVILASGGWTPVVHLWKHARGTLTWCDARQAFLPDGGLDQMQAVGAANGTFDPESCLDEARAVGRAERPNRPKTSFSVTPLVPDLDRKGRQWIDFQHDVTVKDIVVATQENYASVEHMKRYTTLGMAVDQGKTSNMAGLAAMAAARGVPVPAIGTTTFRPPYTPVPLVAYQGVRTKQLYHPVKRLTLEPQHRAAGAALCEYGGWLRPGWYGDGPGRVVAGEEALKARQRAGLFDGSPLGKIEVMGPDAAAFVDFVYYNTMRTLKPGHIRYGFMLTEGGIVYDDGVVARLSDDRFVISCSSSHVDGVRMHLEAWRQDGNDPDRIFIHDLTQQFATVTVTGPKARAIVHELGLGVDVAQAAFPHMTLRDGVFQGTPVRIARVSFTGDVSYEISIPTSKAADLWAAASAIGQPVGAVPIGVEALSIMRAEKGYLIVGKDTDGETMPHDLGFSGPRIKKTDPYVGDRSLHMDKANDADRKQLVGLAVTDGRGPFVTGAHAVRDAQSPRSIGYVTSSYDSPFLNVPIALGLVENGRNRMDELVPVWHDGAHRMARICAPCFLDPEGARLHAE